MLASAGFKALNEKLQWVQPWLHYLGHIISPGLKAISAERVQLIKTMRAPETVTQLQSFFGVGELLPCMDTWLCVPWQRPTMSHSTWNGSERLVELDFWSRRTFRCIEGCYHLRSCLGAIRLFQTVSLACGGGCGCCNGWPKSMVANRWSMVWLNAFVLWLQWWRWLRMAEKIVLSYPLILYTTR